jgi:hypothetical protein
MSELVGQDEFSLVKGIGKFIAIGVLLGYRSKIRTSIDPNYANILYRRIITFSAIAGVVYNTSLYLLQKFKNADADYKERALVGLSSGFISGLYTKNHMGIVVCCLVFPVYSVTSKLFKEPSRAHLPFFKQPVFRSDVKWGYLDK